jgi:prepilin-type N-terminal cleavage/methylation domain-containing protein
MRDAGHSESGFTLIELVLVIVLIALISTFAAFRFESVALWKVDGDLRKFANTWQFLFGESYGRGDAYRLVVNLDENYYLVRREVPLEGTTVRQVDYLANLRSKSEKARRARKEEEEELLSFDQELSQEDARQSGALDELYYETLFTDPHSPKRLAVPVEFPALAQKQQLTEGLSFRDVVIRGETTDSGRVAIRLAPRASAEPALVHLLAGGQVFSVLINPATGRVSVVSGDINASEIFSDSHDSQR